MSDGSSIIPLQRRIRHLFSLEIRNFSLVDCHLNSHVLVNFSLHLDSSSEPIYSSERIPVSIDLCWCGFNIKAILSSKNASVEYTHKFLSSRIMCIKVWRFDQISQTTELIVEFNIDMVDLVPFNAAAYLTHGLSYAPNTLIANLVHGNFAFVLPIHRQSIPKVPDFNLKPPSPIESILFMVHNSTVY